jgi:O-antigen ligase
MPAPWLRLAISTISLFVLGAAAWRLRFTPLMPVTAGLLVLAAALGGLFIIQLVPLPPVLQGIFPAREPFAAVEQAAGMPGGWRPITLSPQATLDSLAALAPAIAACIACLTVPANQRYLLALAVVGVALVNVILATAQKFMGGDSLFIYKAFSAGGPSGFFANRNFFAAQLYASLPMLAALAIAGAKTKRLPGWLVAAVTFAYCGIVLVGLAISSSRSGILLCMAAIVGSLFLPWGNIKSSRMSTRAKLLFYVTALFIFLFGQFGLVGVLRFSEANPLEDYRVSILDTTYRALKEFFPVGSGFGTFVPVYQRFEAPETMLVQFVNHAHNDWVEIVLEGGVPALVLLAAFIGWFAWSSFRIWRRRSDLSGDLTMMAASISAALLMLHSIVDYPLRTPALMTFLGICLGLMASPFAIRQRIRAPLQEMPIASLGPVERKPFRPFQPRPVEPTAGEMQ